MEQPQQPKPEEPAQDDKSSEDADSDDSAGHYAKGPGAKITRSACGLQGLPKVRLSELIEVVNPEFDSSITAEHDQVTCATLLWIYTRIKPKTKISDLRVRTYAKLGSLLVTSNKRLIATMMTSKYHDTIVAVLGTSPTPEVIHNLAVSLGFQQDWLMQKKTKGNGKGSSSSGRVQTQLHVTVEGGVQVAHVPQWFHDQEAAPVPSNPVLLYAAPVPSNAAPATVAVPGQNRTPQAAAVAQQPAQQPLQAAAVVQQPASVQQQMHDMFANATPAMMQHMLQSLQQHLQQPVPEVSEPELPAAIAATVEAPGAAAMPPQDLEVPEALAAEVGTGPEEAMQMCVLPERPWQTWGGGVAVQPCIPHELHRRLYIGNRPHAAELLPIQMWSSLRVCNWRGCRCTL